ncbi:hypothetical protein FZC79_19980 [Rossellomorea vietnamensis]|uniref:Uncharacterized protein n=2 Tax=Rossellomorea TaxID=2837508 RepID=A0A5D4K752_9BACI|nr:MULTISPECIES: hypothetical protein [Rossellomorea]TYR73181.1 hypothetical protein FZC79_19980 [Rossellomorea vietnamensis]TYS79660.1 hypothetical protein FZC80_08410 [Rossellomorea aquimaris]
MNFNMSSAKLLALNLQGFLDLVDRTYRQHSFIVLNQDILYRLKLLVEEFRLQVLTDELVRLTKYEDEERQTLVNIEKVHEKVLIIEEYIENNYDDLFLFSGRVHSIRSIIDSIGKGKG